MHTAGLDATPAYQVLAEELREDIAAKADKMLGASADLDDGADLVRATEVLEASTVLRTSSVDAITAFFQTQIEIADQGETPHLDLISAQALYRQAEASIRRRIDPISEAGSKWNDLQDDDATRDPMETTSNRSQDTMTIELISSELEGLSLDDAAELATVFAAEAGLARKSNDSTQLVVRLGSLIVAELTLTSALILTRSIVGPLRDLAGSADALRLGRDTEDIPVRGPAEVQSAASALNGAVSHLRHAENQALALADGRLDDIVLDMPAESRLGVSLRTAVARLRDSMGESEQYRLHLTHEASHDQLTGIANRSASIIHLSEALTRAQESEGQIAVLFIDLDGFKQVNDRYGHPIGDRFLEQIARRLVRSCREDDVVGRLGGDEFLMIAEPIQGASDALQLAARIMRDLTQPIYDQNTTFHPEASIGVTIGDGSQTANQVIRDADLAVYQAEQLGRGRTELCDDELGARLAEETELEQVIRNAIAANELELFHQPIVDARTGRPQSIETLVRWNRDGVGLVAPDKFIPLAEKSQLIVELDRWVLNRAVQQLSEWKQDPILGSIPMAVNMSGRHLAKGNLLDDVSLVLSRWEVPAQRLTLEITESALLRNLKTVAEPLVELRAMGVRIAIDGFGTGYTSVAHLRNLPADILKIDRSFTANLDRPEDLSLVKLVIETGQILGLEIAAEGVETEEQASTLRDLGTDTLQGDLFGRPSPTRQESGNLAELA